MIDIDKGFARLLENDMLYEHILYMVAEASWTKRLAKGLLRKRDLRRIQKAKGAPDPLYVKQLLKQGKQKQADVYLRKRGLIKSSRQWLAAVERGTQNILKRYKTKVVHKPDSSFTKSMGALGVSKHMGVKTGKTMRDPIGAHAKVNPGGVKRRIHVATGAKKKEQGKRILFNRHETDEVRSAVKQSKSKAFKGSIVPLRPDVGHMSSEVLRKERELVRTAKALYGKKAGGKEISKFRKQSGEYSDLGSKRAIAKADKALRKKHLKSIVDARKEYRKLSPEDRKGRVEMLRQMFQNHMSKKDIQRLIKRVT